MDKRSTIEKAFEKLFKEFDWDQVHKMFEVFGFTYAIPYGECHVPSTLEIEANFLSLVQTALHECESTNEYWIESGRLKVGFKKDKVFCEVVFMKSSNYFA